ncbi:cytoskeleton protein RodZ [Crenobacter luteus]|uniref:HTH cro/C1-type domain-containing protein n=1 Tax=Crenobacter luteus TaxID=1452487 RepID=A0A163CKB9_9NEIS|nr:RodZ domain-containing protein [Crenobacter luteus]KZE32637.1 hypothetical protein AVW16_09565 [Crenobacter luteus]TCP10820.1 cytoskeleton protein RodZ [Crenobacter luteus]
MEQPAEFPQSGVTESVGARLKAARESRGLSLGEVADRLKLSLKQLEAIESDHFEALPGAAFVRGFVRNYARYLELDVAPLMQALDAHFPSSVREVPNLAHHDAAGPSLAALDDEAAEPGGRKGWLLAGAAVAVAAALVFWFNRGGPAEAPAGGETLAPMMTEASANAAAASAPAAAAAPAAPVVPATPAASAPAPAATAAQPGAGSLRVVAAGDAWVAVQDADGKRLIYETLKGGNEKTVSGKPPLKVRIGNAPQVQIYYQGQPVPLASKTRGATARLELN